MIWLLNAVCYHSDSDNSDKLWSQGTQSRNRSTEMVGHSATHLDPTLRHKSNHPNGSCIHLWHWLRDILQCMGWAAWWIWFWWNNMKKLRCMDPGIFVRTLDIAINKILFDYVSILCEYVFDYGFVYSVCNHFFWLLKSTFFVQAGLFIYILRRLFHAFWVDFTQDAILHQLIWMRCCDAIVVQKERSSESFASSWAVYTLSPGLTVAIFGWTWQWVHGAAAHGAMLPQIAQMPIQVKPSRGNSLDTRFKMIQIHFATLFVCHGWKALLFTIPQDVFGCFLPWVWHDVAFKHLDSPFMTNWMVQPDAACRNEFLLRERERCLTTKSKMHHKYVVIQLNINRHEYGDYEAGFSISVMLLM